MTQALSQTHLLRNTGFTVPTTSPRLAVDRMFIGYSTLFGSGLCLQTEDVTATLALTFCLFYSSAPRSHGERERAAAALRRGRGFRWGAEDLLVKRALVLLQLTVMMLTLSVAGGVTPKGQTRSGWFGQSPCEQVQSPLLCLQPSQCAVCVALPGPPDASTISHSPPGNEGITLKRAAPSSPACSPRL